MKKYAPRNAALFVNNTGRNSKPETGPAAIVPMIHAVNVRSDRTGPQPRKWFRDIHQSTMGINERAAEFGAAYEERKFGEKGTGRRLRKDAPEWMNRVETAVFDDIGFGEFTITTLERAADHLGQYDNGTENAEDEFNGPIYYTEMMEWLSESQTAFDYMDEQFFEVEKYSFRDHLQFACAYYCTEVLRALIAALRKEFPELEEAE